MLRKLTLLGAVFIGACNGTPGPVGPVGPQGDAGPQGVAGCPSSSTGQTAGLTATVTVSQPANGAAFFSSGDQPVLTIAFANSCGAQLFPAELSSADLFVYGPRAPLQTVTATALMNSPSGTFAAEQNLIKPVDATGDAGVPNLTLQPNGTITYQLSPITSEDAGTYTASIWAIGPNPLDQTFALVDFQIGTATVESYISGPADSSSCLSCHKNDAVGGKVYMDHIAPGFSPTGNYALDSLPIGSCKSCHNNKGYSPNTILHKVHAVHRGSHQLAPGIAHPEYNEPADDSLSAFLDVNYPPFPVASTPGLTLTADVAMEKDCTSCHTNNVWQTNISRAACGACHDNVFFAGAILADGGVDPTATQGVINPPTVLAGGACTSTVQCTALSSIATCNLSTGNCELTYHQKMTDDTACATCHGVGSVIAPVDVVHNITQWLPPISLDGYKFQNVTVTGGSGPNGSFNVGDKPVLSFQLFDNEATPAPVTDLITNAAWAGTFIVAGPTSNPQRAFGSATGGLSMKSATTGAFTYNASSQTYTYTPTATWPMNALAPINSVGVAPQVNPAGSYTVWFYWARTTATIRDAVDAQVVVPFETTDPVQARQVVTQAACASCHGQSPDGFPRLAEHGDQRKNAETCNMCHSQYAQDFGVGATGLACTASAQCGGNDAGWETCQPNLAVSDGGMICTVTVDPTPGIYIDFQQLVHDIHFARLRAGYQEQANLGNPPAGIPAGTLNYLGFSNSLSNFQQVLSPVDVRSCTNCHADSKAACSSTAPCAFGQNCVSGSCVNVAWQSPTARACITCHDAADDTAHAALNTYTPTSGPPIESCNVCHGEGAEFAVDMVHNITTLYSTHLAYPREP
jgi:OmcA/MtrC family decaheme c-type cytochrome